MLVYIHPKKELLYVLYFILIFLIVYDEFEIFKIKDSNLKEYTSKTTKIFMIIFYLYENNLIKKEKPSNLDERISEGNNTIKNVIYLENNKKKIKIGIIILLSIIFEIISSITEIFIGKFSDIIIFQYSENCLILLVDLIFFKTVFHKHYILATSINCFLFLVIFFYFSKSMSKPYFILIFIILSNYTYAFSRLLLRFLNTNYYISIYLLGSILGIVQLCFIFIKKIIFHENYSIKNVTPLYHIIIQFFAFLFLNLLYFKILIIDPIYTLLCFNFPYFLFSFINNEIKKYSFINFIPIISSLIYLDVFVDV